MWYRLNALERGSFVQTVLKLRSRNGGSDSVLTTIINQAASLNLSGPLGILVLKKYFFRDFAFRFLSLISSSFKLSIPASLEL